MDRRQRKTREAIFTAFADLLARKDFNRITVEEIITAADVGRATFYAHFQTKDFLLKGLCDELFCHLFDAETHTPHRHVFDCDSTEPVFLHLLRHLQKNDNNILTLLSGQNNELFLPYFRNGLDSFIDGQSHLFASHKSAYIPDSFWKNHIASTFTATVKWWIDGGMRQSPEEIHRYFFEVV